MRYEQKEKRKLEIIIASIDIFVAKGYTGTKIQDIATSAGMSVGLLFHYFKNKEELFTELTKIAVDGTKLPYGMYYESMYEFFYGLTEYFIDSIQKQPYRAKIFTFLSMVKRSNDVPKDAKKLISKENMFDIIESFIKKGQNEGSITNENSKVLAYLYWSMIQEIMNQYLINPKIPLPKPETIICILISNHDKVNQDINEIELFR
ncbi:TetR/AcrR family transcriptional regulator [Anaerorhabdus sp.]|uniref:TetR/AcrR family transcriptional regulator n=1 Tax=Anaerorhabdus sp. TaxID=1872524 RepID=UPI002FCC219A